MLTLIVYERERRALGSFLAPSARGATSRSSRRPESLACSAPAAGLPALATDNWHLCNIADIDNKERSELDRDLDDVEEVEEEETGEETKIKACQLSVEMMQNPRILAALQERLIRWSGRNSSRMH